jgi:sugar phosphate isomerase/epimerase
MKSSSSIGISIRDQIISAAEGRSFAEAIRMIGADSIECAVEFDDLIPSLDGSLRDGGSIAELMGRASAQGLRISALLLATDFSGDSADAQVDWAAAVIRAAARMSVPVVRIDPWTADGDLPPNTVIENFIRRTKALLEQTADTTVDVGMENHGQVFNDPQVLDRVLSALPDQRFGLTLDTGNLYWWGQPVEEVYRLIERYASRAKHTHIKNINYPADLANQRRELGYEYKQYCCSLPEGNLDLKRIVELLRQSGYARDLCVEDESLFKVAEADRIEVLKREVQALRAILI